MSLSFPIHSLNWKRQEDLPTARLVLARIEHFSGARPPRLVMACGISDGIVLADGSQLGHDWHVAGWLEPDFEIELLPVSAATATPRPLTWETLSNGSAYAEDGLGGTYVIRPRKHGHRLTHEADFSTYLSVAPESDPRMIAQAHHEDRLRRTIIDAPD